VTGYTPPGVESPVPFRSSARPPGGKAGIDLVSDGSPAAFWRQCVPRLGCLLRLNVSPMVKKMVGCVFFPPRCEQQLGNSPAMAGVTSQSRWVTSVTTRVTVQLSTTNS